MFGILMVVRTPSSLQLLVAEAPAISITMFWKTACSNELLRTRIALFANAVRWTRAHIGWVEEASGISSDLTMTLT